MVDEQCGTRGGDAAQPQAKHSLRRELTRQGKAPSVSAGALLLAGVSLSSPKLAAEAVVLTGITSVRRGRVAVDVEAAAVAVEAIATLH